MLLLEKMEKTTMTSTEAAAAKYLLENPSAFRGLSIRQTAALMYTTPSTLIRLAQRLEFQGWSDFVSAFFSEIDYIESHFQGIDANRPFSSTDNQRIIANKISELCIESIRDTMSLLDYDELAKAVRLMKKAQNIYIAAISVSLSCARLFESKMKRIGKHVIMENTLGEDYYTLMQATPTDCVIVVSYSGSTDRIAAQVQELRRKKIPLILLTSLGNNVSKSCATCTLTITTREKLFSKIGSFSSEESILLLLNILFSCYFATDYDSNWKKHIDVAHQCEYVRHTTNQIMQEALEAKKL